MTIMMRNTIHDYDADDVISSRERDINMLEN